MSWDIIQDFVAYGLTAVIGAFGSKFFLGGKIKIVQELLGRVSRLMMALLGALQPDADGQVRITPDEVAALRLEIEKLIAILNAGKEEQ